MPVSVPLTGALFFLLLPPSFPSPENRSCTWTFRARAISSITSKLYPFLLTYVNASAWPRSRKVSCSQPASGEESVRYGQLGMVSDSGMVSDLPHLLNVSVERG